MMNAAEVVPPTFGSALLAATSARSTAAFGPFRVALVASPEEATVRTWHDPPGLPADLTATLGAVHAAQRPVELRVYRLNQGGFAYSGAESAGTGDWRTAQIAARVDPLTQRISEQATIETMMTLGHLWILRAGGLLLHATTLVLDGRAWVVCGHSGAGKTTLSARFNSRCLNHEFAFVMPTAAGWVALRHAEHRGIPKDLPWELPLGGLCVLGPDRTRNASVEISHNDAMQLILDKVYFADGPALPPMLENLDALLTAMPVRRLSHCLTEPIEAIARTITLE